VTPGPAEAGHYRDSGPAEAGHYRDSGPAKAGYYRDFRSGWSLAPSWRRRRVSV